MREELSAQLTSFCDEVSQKQDSILKELQQSHQELLSEISDRLPRLVVKAAARVIEDWNLILLKSRSRPRVLVKPRGRTGRAKMNHKIQLLKGIYEAAVEKAQAASESNEDFSQALSRLFGTEVLMVSAKFTLTSNLLRTRLLVEVIV